MNRALLSVLLLTAVYALMLVSVDPWDLLFGAGVSVAVLVAFRRFLFGGRPSSIGDLGRRVSAVPLFAWAIVRDITVGTWQVASVVSGLRPLSHPGIVAIPLEDRTETGVVVSAFVATLAPGEYLVEIEWAERRMLMHVLDAGDPNAVRERFATFYRRYQRRLAP